MPAFDAQSTSEKVQAILAIIQSGDGESALSRISDLVSELRLLEGAPDARAEGEGESAAPGPEPQPSRVIAAHLKAAEVEIQATHMSPAEDSLTKALYVALHGIGQAAGGQLNV